MYGRYRVTKGTFPSLAAGATFLLCLPEPALRRSAARNVNSRKLRVNAKNSAAFVSRRWTSASVPTVFYIASRAATPAIIRLQTDPHLFSSRPARQDSVRVATSFCHLNRTKQRRSTALDRRPSMHFAEARGFVGLGLSNELLSRQVRRTL